LNKLNALKIGDLACFVFRKKQYFSFEHKKASAFYAKAFKNLMKQTA